MKTVFLGDSLTAGLPGVSYWRFLHNKAKLINRGVGGDTLLGAIDRAEIMLNDPKYDDIDQYIIEIGTNDVLLPVLQKRSFILEMFVKIEEKTNGSVPCKNIDTFSIKYEQLLQRLIKLNKKTGVIGLPMIETNTLLINETMMEYDAVIVGLCSKYSIPYLDVRQLEAQMKGGNHGTYIYGNTNLFSVIDSVLTSILPLSMLISKLRGLVVTIDGTHLNRKMAKVLAVAIEAKFLKQ